MKKIILFTISLAVMVTTQAQQFKMDKIYAQLGTEAIEIKSVFNNKWTITASSALFNDDPKLPSDYKASPGVSFYQMPRGPIPDYKLESTARFSHVAFGRFYPVTRSISFTVDAGLGIAIGQTYDFQKRTPNDMWWNELSAYSTNYNITTTNVAGMGGIVKAGVDWAFSSFAGLGVDAFYNYNSGGIKSHSGLNIKLLIGWMNRPAK